jgi:hypothetical protein
VHVALGFWRAWVRDELECDDVLLCVGGRAGDRRGATPGGVERDALVVVGSGVDRNGEVALLDEEGVDGWIGAEDGQGVGRARNKETNLCRGTVRRSRTCCVMRKRGGCRIRRFGASRDVRFLESTWLATRLARPW